MRWQAKYVCIAIVRERPRVGGLISSLEATTVSRRRQWDERKRVNRVQIVGFGIEGQVEHVLRGIRKVDASPISGSRGRWTEMAVLEG